MEKCEYSLLLHSFVPPFVTAVQFPLTVLSRSYRRPVGFAWRQHQDFGPLFWRRDFFEPVLDGDDVFHETATLLRMLVTSALGQVCHFSEGHKCCTAWSIQFVRYPNFFFSRMEADRNVKVVAGDVTVL